MTTKKPTYEELEQRVKELEKGPYEEGQFEDRHQLSLAIEQSGEGIAIVDLDGNLKYLNAAFSMMHGYSHEELIGKNLSIFHSPEQLPSVDAANRQLKKTGAFKGEIWHVRRDGTLFPTLMHNSLIKDDEGKPIGLLGALRDISDMKQAEKALRESEASYRSLFENANLAFSRSSLDGKIMAANSEFIRMFGYESLDDLNATVKNANELFADPQRRAEIVRLWEEDPALNRFENTYLRKDGSKFSGKLTTKAIMASDDRLQFFEGFIEDITDRKQAEEDLRESEEKYRTILESIEDGYYEADIAGNLTFFNDSLCKILGYSKDELKGMNYRQYTDERTAKQGYNVFNKIYTTERADKGFGWEIIRKDGTKRVVEASISLRSDAGGEPIREWAWV